VTKEYYGGQGERKNKSVDLPGHWSISCKSTSSLDYAAYTVHVVLNLQLLFRFHGFDNAAADRWTNFVSKQASIKESVNILIGKIPLFYARLVTA
jgi:hypothetical protein